MEYASIPVRAVEPPPVGASGEERGPVGRSGQERGLVTVVDNQGRDSTGGMDEDVGQREVAEDNQVPDAAVPYQQQEQPQSNGTGAAQRCNCRYHELKSILQKL